MFIILKDFDKETVDQVIHKIQETSDKYISSEYREDYEPVNGEFHIVTTGYQLFSNRLLDLGLASAGAVVYGEWDEQSPLYAGPKEGFKPERAVARATFAENRAAYYRTFDVTYLGRTYVNPRNVVLLNKGRDTILNIDKISSAATPEWWGSCAFVSVNNAEKIKDFYEEFPFTVFLAFEESAKAKLDWVGVPYATIPSPDEFEDPYRYGIEIRQLSNRFSQKMSIEDYEKELE